ncbi:Structural maintenance of chromosomes protein 2, partial [Ceratobasidium sp. 392]
MARTYTEYISLAWSVPSDRILPPNPDPNDPKLPAPPPGTNRLYLSTPSGPLELLYALPNEASIDSPAGPSWKTPILFLHGGFGSWYPGFWAMAITSKNVLADDLVAALQFIQKRHPDTGPISLVGHSAGGGLSQHLIDSGKGGSVGKLVIIAGFPCYGGSASATTSPGSKKHTPLLIISGAQDMLMRDPLMKWMANQYAATNVGIGYNTKFKDVSRKQYEFTSGVPDSSNDEKEEQEKVKAMRIEELIIEGFKSYPSRTTITGWDPSFNAITGLNGTGKSNILDAISFVLGLTDYKELRASNLQELIYKKGAAGITKASVTIVFDNSDEANSPSGFQNYKQITVTRQISAPNKNKYIVNGHVFQQQNVQSLFQSVQLNINNPNFVIRQGKITKVLNMGSREILGLIEEASGTRMYEEKKEKALRTISKKEKKVEEITSLLAEEINPKLSKLRKEKESYVAYTEALSKAESLGRVVSAFQYTDYNHRISERENEIENANAKVADMEKQRKDRIKEKKQAAVQQEEVAKKRDAEMQKDGKLKGLEEEMNKCEKEAAKVQAQVEIVEGTIKENKAKAVETQEALEKLEGSLEESRDNLANTTAEFTTAKEAHAAAQHSLSTAEELQQTLLTGLSSSANTSTGGYLGGIAEAKSRAAAAETEAKQAKVQLGMAQTDMKEKEGRARKMESEGQQGKDALERGRAEVAQLNAKLEKCGWNRQMKDELDGKMRQAREAMGKARDAVDRVRNSLSNLDFTYSDPTPNFDRTSVLGYIANLTRLTPEVADTWSTALEICAGGKLYNVVVRDERVGSQLLKNGQLRKRVTLIPLTKISPPRASAEAIAKAKRIAPGKVFLALELVKYPAEARAAMEFVYGDTLICEDDATAKAVTFDRDIRMRSVTKHGSVYDPSGTLSGGSAPSSGGILKRVQEMQ